MDLADTFNTRGGNQGGGKRTVNKTTKKLLRPVRNLKAKGLRFMRAKNLKGGAKLAQGAVKGISKVGGVLKGGSKLLGGVAKGAMKAIPGVGLALTAISAGVDAYKGWKNAAAISGKDPDKVTTGDKVKAATASALSGLTFGLVDSQTMFKRC